MGTRGRPPNQEGQKSASITVRVTPQLRRALELAAEQNGCKLSEEVEHRLNYSLLDYDREDRDAPTRDLCYLIEKLTIGMQAPARIDLGWKEARTWQNDRYLFEAFKAAISGLVDRLASPPKGIDPATIETLLRFAAGTRGLGKGEAAFFKTPKGFARLTVQGFWHWFMTTRAPSDVHGHLLRLPVQDPFYQFPKIRRAFRLDQPKGGKP